MSSELLYLGVGAAVLYFVTKKKPVPPAPPEGANVQPKVDTSYPTMTAEQAAAAPPARRDWYMKINPRTGVVYASLTEYLTTPLTEAEIAAMGGDGAYSRRRL